MTVMEKRRVTVTSVVFVGKDLEDSDLYQRHEAVDHVQVDHLDAYVTDARTRWQHVDVGTAHDPGPGGEDGEYALPQHLADGVSLEDHLDSLGVPNRTDDAGNVVVPEGYDGRFNVPLAGSPGDGRGGAVMLYQTAMKNYLATQYASKLADVGLLTALGTGGSSAGTEPSGGSPAYARVANGAGSASAGVVSGTPAAINVPSGATIVGCGMFDVSSGAPTDYDQASVTSQAFASQGTYTVTWTYTQT